MTEMFMLMLRVGRGIVNEWRAEVWVSVYFLFICVD